MPHLAFVKTLATVISRSTFRGRCKRSVHRCTHHHHSTGHPSLPTPQAGASDYLLFSSLPGLVEIPSLKSPATQTSSNGPPGEDLAHLIADLTAIPKERMYLSDRSPAEPSSRTGILSEIATQGEELYALHLVLRLPWGSVQTLLA